MVGKISLNVGKDRNDIKWNKPLFVKYATLYMSHYRHQVRMCKFKPLPYNTYVLKWFRQE